MMVGLAVAYAVFASLMLAIHQPDVRVMCAVTVAAVACPLAFDGLVAFRVAAATVAVLLLLWSLFASTAGMIAFLPAALPLLMVNLDLPRRRPLRTLAITGLLLALPWTIAWLR